MISKWIWAVCAYLRTFIAAHSRLAYILGVSSKKADQSEHHRQNRKRISNEVHGCNAMAAQASQESDVIEAVVWIFDHVTSTLIHDGRWEKDPQRKSSSNVAHWSGSRAWPRWHERPGVEVTIDHQGPLRNESRFGRTRGRGSTCPSRDHRRRGRAWYMAAKAICPTGSLA